MQLDLSLFLLQPWLPLISLTIMKWATNAEVMDVENPIDLCATLDSD
jgi:hypothetical protein